MIVHARTMASPHPSTPDPAWENPVRQRLQAGDPVFGVTITTNNLETTARLAAAGFDFLWIEMEHSPVTLETLRAMVLATRGLPAVPFARVPVNALWTAKRVLDMGVLGVAFPFTSTPELAAQAVAACRYPPVGRRGSGAGLATFRWPAPEGYHDFADRAVLTIAIIEETAALEHVDAIAATPGLDVVFVGPSDLSFSLGHRGDMEHSAVREAMAKIREATRRHGKVLGRYATRPEQIARALDEGYRFIQTGTELDLLAAGARQLLEPLGRRPAGPSAGAGY